MPKSAGGRLGNTSGGTVEVMMHCICNYAFILMFMKLLTNGVSQNKEGEDVKGEKIEVLF